MTTQPVHHLQDDLLLGHASGRENAAVALFVSVHEALCGECRDAGDELTQIGAAMFEEGEALEMGSGARERTLAAIAKQPHRSAAAPGKPVSLSGRSATVDFVLGLRDRPHDAKWRWRAPGVSEVRLPLAWNGIPVTVARLRRGLHIPQHTHRGRELTLILSGGFRDEVGRYGPGDVADYDSSVSHEQFVDGDEDCLCLVVNEGRLVPQTLLGRVLAWISGA